MERRIIEIARKLNEHNKQGSNLEAQLVTALNDLKSPAVRVAKEIGVSPQYLSDIKKGRRTVSRDLVIRIASLSLKC